MKSLFTAFALCLIGSALSAQTLPLEDKARFEKSLEDKTESVLDQMLGPGQAKIVVDATIDFTRTEKVDMHSAGKQGQASSSRFLWESMRADENSRPQVLPGFSVPQSAAAPAGPDNEKFERQLSYPEAFLKRLDVTMILNQSIPAAQAENTRAVVAGLLGVRSERGDTLNIVRADFPPPWKAALYSRDTAGALVKYAAFTVLSLLAIGVMAVCFLKLAEAVNSMARAQTHQVQLEIPRPTGPLGPNARSELAGESPPALEHGGNLSPGEGAPDDILFDVRPDQAELLIEMIGREDAANIALVVSHLPAATRQAFLAKLSPQSAAEIMEVLSHVKFVDLDTISRLKEELERRLKGAVGGPQHVLSLLNGLDVKTQKDMLERLATRSPDLAREVRRTLLFMEDLPLLGDRDVETLSASIGLEDWAAVLADAPAGLADKVKAALPERSWLIIEQTKSARRTGLEKVRLAQEKLLAAAQKMIREGFIQDPRAARPGLQAPATASAEPSPKGKNGTAA